MKPGDRVRMNQACIDAYCGPCGLSGPHAGEMSDDDEFGSGDVCSICSRERVLEFKDCTGVVQGLSDYGNGILGPEWDVIWEPSGLRYVYQEKYLDTVE